MEEKEEEAAFLKLFDVGESILASDFLRLVLLKRSSMDFCLSLSAP